MKLKVQVPITSRTSLNVIGGLGRAVRAFGTWVSKILRRRCTRTLAYGTMS
jgi:hypothetical protein